MLMREPSQLGHRIITTDEPGENVPDIGFHGQILVSLAPIRGWPSSFFLILCVTKLPKGCRQDNRTVQRSIWAATQYSAPQHRVAHGRPSEARSISPRPGFAGPTSWRGLFSERRARDRRCPDADVLPLGCGNKTNRPLCGTQHHLGGHDCRSSGSLKPLCWLLRYSVVIRIARADLKLPCPLPSKNSSRINPISS
jgi:hypothetical protein